MEHQKLFLGKWQASVDGALKELETNQAATRIWERDPTLWKSEPEHQKEISQRLGWLDLPGTMRQQVADLESFAQSMKDEGLRHVVLCGMGGSSLCPEVLRLTLGSTPGYPSLFVLDTTDPTMIARVAQQADPASSLYLISSKSGGTIEVDSLFRFFFGRTEKVISENPGSRFIAVTDPGTGLEWLAKERQFRKVFLNPPDIGGRYSALSLFGLVPAALIGLDTGKMLDRATGMAKACAATMAAESNPGLMLGAAIGALAREGRDKLTLLTSPRLSSLGLWVEQLIAESTGKEGKGIVPVAGEPMSPTDVYGSDRLFVMVRLEGDDNSTLDLMTQELKAGNQPVIVLSMADDYDLAAEFFRWEFATAAAGALLSIDPFDQPNVQESKDNTGRLLTTFKEKGNLPVEQPGLETDGIKVYGTVEKGLAEALNGLLSQGQPGDYVALMAYLDMSGAIEDALEGLRRQILQRTQLATTLGYGPRFLHSTGQLHKGGPNSGIFIQITAEDSVLEPIPGQPYDFGILKAAQALGDWQSLGQHGRRAISINLGKDVLGGLAKVARAL